MEPLKRLLQTSLPSKALVVTALAVKVEPYGPATW
jgi:hypothetical protein